MSDPLATGVRPAAEHSLGLQITVAALARLVINTSRRFIYPYAPVLSRGLGVPLTSITSLIAVNQLTGILSPLFGPLSDRWGYRVMMMAGLGMLAIGMLSGGFLPFYAMLVVAMFLAGLGKSIFDPALQAYVGEKVPYERRGRVIGLIELSWAGSALIGIPLVGLLIVNLGWRAPFFVLGGLGLLSVVALGLVIPKERRHADQIKSTTHFSQAWRQLFQKQPVWGVLILGFFISMANDNLFVIFGAWLETDFNLGIIALGTATTVIGVAELIGETLTATVADRIGPKRAIITGLTLSIFSYVLLPIISQTLLLAMVGLFVTFVTFEFTVVTSFSLVTEVLPDARATMASAYVAANGLGRMAGAVIGGFVWFSGGLPLVGLVSAGLSIIALVGFLWGLRQWQP